MTLRRRSGRSLRAALPALAIAIGAAAAVPPVAAQERDWVNPDVNALREEVTSLRNEVAALRGAPQGGAAAGGVAIAPSGGADFDRLSRLENALRQLTGQIERLEYEHRQTVGALTQRIATLEAAAGVTPPAEGPTAAAPTAQPQAAAASVASPPGRGAPARALGEIPGAAAAAVPGANPLGPEPETPAQPLPVGPSADEASYQKALDALRGRAYDDAEAMFRAFIDANPRDSRVGDATYWLGETHYLRGQFDAAAEVFLGGFRSYPTASRAPDMLFRLGMTFVRRQQINEACMTFREVRARYPDAPARTLKRTDIEAQRAGCG